MPFRSPSHRAPRRALIALVVAVCALAPIAAGCGRKNEQSGIDAPKLGVRGTQDQAAKNLGYPEFATKNTSRVGGADPIANAAAVARAVFPGTPGQRPNAVVLADAGDWRGALAASVLMSDPVRAPVLFSDGRDMPAATADALHALRPSGSKAAGGAQIIRVGDVARPAGYKTTDVAGRDPAALARALDAFQAAARGATSDRVLVVTSDDPSYALPAAAWAAKSGDPILFTERDALPPDTRAAIAAHQQPKIYVLGPSKVISPKVTRELRKLGKVTRIGGPDPVRNAIDFARYADGTFGWGIIDPGHGLVFANQDIDPANAAAAAPLSSSGTYGPLLLVSGADKLDSTLRAYLLDIQPGYTKDPVRGVYNRGWIVGDARSVSPDLQSRIDSLLEIIPVTEKSP